MLYRLGTLVQNVHDKLQRPIREIIYKCLVGRLLTAIFCLVMEAKYCFELLKSRNQIVHR